MNGRTAIQYIQNTRRPKQYPHNLESIIIMMSRYIEESVMLNSQIDT